jgi:hypothetical protein
MAARTTFDLGDRAAAAIYRGTPGASKYGVRCPWCIRLKPLQCSVLGSDRSTILGGFLISPRLPQIIIVLGLAK